MLPDKLRFDFSNAGPVEAAQLAAVEKICREAVAAAMPVFGTEVPLAQAKSINGLRWVWRRGGKGEEWGGKARGGGETVRGRGRVGEGRVRGYQSHTWAGGASA